LALETKVAPILYRVGRLPDAWQPADWSRASLNGTFDNRFDDPESYYRVLYASSQEVSCFVETLARFRPDITLLAELREIEGEDDFATLGQVPLDWNKNRGLGSASTDGNFAEICGGEWITMLRKKLASDCLSLGVKDFDASVLQSASPRLITQLASRVVYELGLPGIYYRSRYGHNFENWALFEPFRIRNTMTQPIPKHHPALIQATEILGLSVGD